jgi:uncharacterized membrane protein
MLASERAATRAVQPLLTVGTIALLAVAVTADVTGLLAPASVWGSLAVWNLGAAVAVAFASVGMALFTAVASAAATPAKRADFIRDLTLFATLVAAAVSFVWRVRADTQLPAAAPVMAALVALCTALVAGFFESD